MDILEAEKKLDSLLKELDFLKEFIKKHPAKHNSDSITLQESIYRYDDEIKKDLKCYSFLVKNFIREYSPLVHHTRFPQIVFTYFSNILVLANIVDMEIDFDSIYEDSFKPYFSNIKHIPAQNTFNFLRSFLDCSEAIKGDMLNALENIRVLRTQIAKDNYFFYDFSSSEKDFEPFKKEDAAKKLLSNIIVVKNCISFCNYLENEHLIFNVKELFNIEPLYWGEHHDFGLKRECNILNIPPYFDSFYVFYQSNRFSIEDSIETKEHDLLYDLSDTEKKDEKEKLEKELDEVNDYKDKFTKCYVEINPNRRVFNFYSIIDFKNIYYFINSNSRLPVKKILKLLGHK